MSPGSGDESFTRTMTLRVGAPQGDGESRRVLLALGRGVQTTYPLGRDGRVSVGRGAENMVAIDDPTMSRNHIVLHLGPTLRVEDLGSSNGTRVGRKKLAKNEIVELALGETVEIGSAVLIVQERKREAPPQRLLTWDYFELRLEEAIRRGRRLDRSFVVLQIQADWRHAAAVERRMVALLPQLDAVARDVPGEFSVLMVDADELDGEAAARWLATALEDPRVQVAVGQAVYPADGSTVDELTTCAARRAAGAEEETRDVDEPVSVDPATKRLFRLVERVAAVPLHVLVVGDAGVGKSLVAGELHRRSGRAPVLTLDGGADDLFEVLFGDEGRLERARGGVLVIDKLCAMPLDAQARLATWLETAEREGGTDTAVRVIAMESRDVDAAVDAAELHRELHALLTNVVVEVPPLRRRPADIEPLARRFVSEAAAAGERPEPELTLDAIDLLRGHVWPGNVRELRGVMRRAVALSDGMVITPRELPVEKLTAAFVADSTAELPAPQLFDEVRRERESIERQRIVDTLEQADGNQTKAAKLLGISRRTLINRLEAYGLPRPRKRR